jgi:hypothetical protein
MKQLYWRRYRTALRHYPLLLHVRGWVCFGVFCASTMPCRTIRT